jgi:hypothetical protein
VVRRKRTSFLLGALAAIVIIETEMNTWGNKGHSDYRVMCQSLIKCKELCNLFILDKCVDSFVVDESLFKGCNLKNNVKC